VEDAFEQVALQLQGVVQRLVGTGVDGPLDHCLRLQRPLGDLGGERQGPLVQHVGGDDLVGETDSEGLVGLDLPAGDHQLLCSAGADRAWQPLRAATAGDDPEEDLRLAENGAFAGDAVVAGESQFAATSQCIAADSGDDEAGDVGDGIECGVEAGGDVMCLLGVTELADVGAGGEEPLSPCDDHRPGRVTRHVFGGGAQLGEHRARESVDLRIVERDDRHAISTTLDEHEFSHARHPTPAARTPALPAFED
jgi:hypothetical protein